MNKQFWKNKNVFVTGATGIVGSWLVKDLLSASAHVVALIYERDARSELYRSGDIKKVTREYGSLEDFAKLNKIIKKHKIDTVLHLGAQTIVNTAYDSPFLAFEANVRGTYNVLEACRVSNGQVKRIVVASSDKAYGTHKTLPYQEHMPLQGQYPYEVSKSCADLIANAYHCSYQLPVVIARCGNIFGGGDLNWSRIVPETIQSLLKKQRPVIRCDGTFIRDYVYVKDITQAYIDLAENIHTKKISGEAFNFSNECPMTVLEIVGLIQEIMDSKHLEVRIANTAKGEIHSQYLCAAKARKVLGWKPRFSIEEGLKETIGWYEEFFSK